MSQTPWDPLPEQLRYVQARFESELAERRSIDGALSFPASSISVLGPALTGATLVVRSTSRAWMWVALLGLAAVAAAGVLVVQVWSGFRYRSRPTLAEEEALRRMAQAAAEKGTVLVLRTPRWSTGRFTTSAQEIYLRELVRRVSVTTDHANALNRRRRDLLQVVVALLVIGLMCLVACGIVMLQAEVTP